MIHDGVGEHELETLRAQVHPLDPRRRPGARAQGRDHDRRSPARHARGLDSRLSWAHFEYTALDTAGRSRKGVIEGDTPRHVRSLLRERQLLPVTVEEVAAQRIAAGSAAAASALHAGVSAADLSLMTRQLSTLVRAGLPLEEALLAVSQQTEKPRVQSILLGVRAKVVEGHTLATGLGDFPRVFPEIYRATVSAGEQSGHLDAVLERLAEYTESREQMRQKVMGAMLYPMVLTVMCFAHRLDPADLCRAEGGRSIRSQSRQAAARHAGTGGRQRLSAQLRHLAADRDHRHRRFPVLARAADRATRGGAFTWRC